jgi:hypothetical protein
MPKTLRLSTLQMEIFKVLQNGEDGEEFTAQQLADKAGHTLIEVKSIVWVLIARKLIERENKEGRAVFRLR